MIRKSYRIATERIDYIYWTLLLSCILKEQLLRCGWQIYLKVRDNEQVEIYVWILNLIPSKAIKQELDYIAHLTGELKGQVDYQCQKYQNWKTILESKGSSFLEKRKGCIAIGSKTFDKFKPAQRFFTVPADLFDSVFTHKIDFFRRLNNPSGYGTIEKNIIPLIKGINNLPSTSTISSCQGHFLWPSNRYPFVCFVTNIETVKRIHGIIRLPDLKLGWTLAGTVENGCPSLGPYIIWKLATKERLNIFHNRQFRQDIARLYSLLRDNAMSQDKQFP